MYEGIFLLRERKNSTEFIQPAQASIQIQGNSRFGQELYGPVQVGKLLQGCEVLSMHLCRLGFPSG